MGQPIMSNVPRSFAFYSILCVRLVKKKSKREPICSKFMWSVATPPRLLSSRLFECSLDLLFLGLVMRARGKPKVARATFFMDYIYGDARTWESARVRCDQYTRLSDSRVAHSRPQTTPCRKRYTWILFPFPFRRLVSGLAFRLRSLILFSTFPLSFHPCTFFFIFFMPCELAWGMKDEGSHDVSL